jgi:O-antigen/teichoic acid export membrane protein
VPTSTEQPPIDLPRRSVRSGAVVMVAQVITVALGIGSMAVLGRLLTPADFGVVSIATAFVAFVIMLPNQGLPQAIVQRDDLTDAQLNSLFWLNVGAGVVAALIGTLAAWPISVWFDRPDLFWIMTVLAGALITTGLGAPHAAVLRRALRFRTHATVGVVANLIGVATGIATAFAGWSYWALVAMTVTTTATRAIGMWACSGWTPSRPAIVGGIRPMVRIAAYLNGTSLLTTTSRSISRIMIGYGLGDAAVGYYTNASRLVVQPATQLNTPLNSVAIPTLSRLQSDPERFRAFYRRGLEVVVFMLCPFMLVAMASAEHLVLLFLGPQWTESIPLFRALTPAGLVACTGVATSWVYIPLGRTDRQFHWRIVASVVMIGAVLLGLQWGTLGVAVAFSGQAVAMRIPAIAYCIHGTFLRGADVAIAVWRIALASVPAVLAGWWCAGSLPIETSHLAACAAIATTTFAIYLLAFACTPGGLARLRANAELARHLMRPPKTR